MVARPQGKGKAEIDELYSGPHGDLLSLAGREFRA
jgi:hypothetical protein